MYKVLVQKEVATTLQLTKIYIDEKKVGRTNTSTDNSFDSDEYGKSLYMKGLFFRTNKVKTPEKDSVYNLTWKQNYLFIIIFMIVILVSAFRFVGDESYTMGMRVLVLAVFAPIINLFWNDLLIIGRKIQIKEVGE